MMRGLEKMIAKIVLFGFKNHYRVNKKTSGSEWKDSKQKRQDLGLDLTLFSLDLDSTRT